MKSEKEVLQINKFSENIQLIILSIRLRLQYILQLIRRGGIRGRKLPPPAGVKRGQARDLNIPLPQQIPLLPLAFQDRPHVRATKFTLCPE